MLLGILSGGLLGSLLIGKGQIRADDGTIRAGKGTTRVGQEF